MTEPAERVAPIIPVVKPNGKIRICVDLKKLNQAVRRERYVIPTVDDVIHPVKGSSVFSKLDAASGFWQISLDRETEKLTTFITHSADTSSPIYRLASVRLQRYFRGS